MATTALVQALVTADVEKRAAEVLKDAGMTVEQAIQEMLERTAGEGLLPFLTRGEASGNKDPGYDEWFRAQVQEALDDPGELISHDEATARMQQFREEFLAKKAKAA